MITITAIILTIIILLLTIVGSYMILTSILPVPDTSYGRAVKAYTKRAKAEKKAKASPVGTAISLLADKFAKYVPINALKYSRLKKSLHIAGSNKTPEQYTAEKYVVLAIFAAIALIALQINVFLAAFVAAIAAAWFIGDKKDEKTAERKGVAKIEKELPKFAAYIKQSLNTTTNVITLLEEYKTSNEAFLRELRFTLADIKTSNFDGAISRLDNRYNSDMLKMVTNGLRSIYNGEEVKEYFHMLERDFAAFEVNMLRKDVKNITRKMKLPAMLIYFSVMATFMLPLAMSIIDGIKEIF